MFVLTALSGLVALGAGCPKKKTPAAGTGSAAGTAAGTAATPPASQPAAKTPPAKTPDKPKGKRGWMARKMAKLTEAAKLTPEQAKQIGELMKAEMKARREAWKANAGAKGKKGRAKVKAAMAAARKASDDAVKKLLKPDQFAAYTKLRDEWAAKRKARREARRKRMKEALAAFAKDNKLKPKQVKQLGRLMRKAYRAHRMAWGEMKGMDKEARKAKRKEMRDQMDAQVKKVLNAKQFAAYQAWHKKMREERRARWKKMKEGGGGHE